MCGSTINFMDQFLNLIERIKNMSDAEIGIKEIPSTKKLIRTIDSEKLLNGKKELIITHRGEVYRLHLTKSGKLLLTK
jgi:hemin uptake protein HemP